MGTLTLTQLQAEVRAGMGNRTDLDTRLERAMNIGQTILARKATRWEELETINAGTLPFTSTPANDKSIPFATINAAFNPREIYSFRVIEAGNTGRHQKLDYLSTREFDRKLPEPEYFAVGFPSIYTIWGEQFELYKVTDAAYKYEIRSSVWPTAFSDASPSAVSDFKEKDDIIIAYAISYLFDTLGKADNAKEWLTRGNFWLNDAVGEDMKKPDREIVGFQDPNRAAVQGKYWLDPFIKRAQTS